MSHVDNSRFIDFFFSQNKNEKENRSFFFPIIQFNIFFILGRSMAWLRPPFSVLSIMSDFVQLKKNTNTNILLSNSLIICLFESRKKIVWKIHRKNRLKIKKPSNDHLIIIFQLIFNKCLENWTENWWKAEKNMIDVVFFSENLPTVGINFYSKRNQSYINHYFSQYDLKSWSRKMKTGLHEDFSTLLTAKKGL